RAPAAVAVPNLLRLPPNTSRLAAIALLIAAAAVAALVLTLLYVNRQRILGPLVDFCSKIRSLGAVGHLILTALVFLSSFPFLVGYGTLLVLSGFIFGFPSGIIPAYTGAVLGAVACFFIFRRWLGAYYRRLILKHYPQFKAVEAAIETGGLKLMILIRLAPYPYGIMNLLLATTGMPAWRYITATAIGETKNLFHVYVGSTLRSLADLSAAPSSAVEIAAIVVGLVAAAAGFAYLTLLVRRAIRDKASPGLAAGDAFGDGCDEEDGDLGDDDDDDGCDVEDDAGAGTGARPRVHLHARPRRISPDTAATASATTRRPPSLAGSAASHTSSAVYAPVPPRPPSSDFGDAGPFADDAGPFADDRRRPPRAPSPPAMRMARFTAAAAAAVGADDLEAARRP
ncbi:Tlg2-vesicle protein, partial [Cladochytrium tenue]